MFIRWSRVFYFLKCHSRGNSTSCYKVNIGINSEKKKGLESLTVLDQDGDSCDQLDCLLLAYKQPCVCVAVRVAVTFQESESLCKWSC